ncbi:uncharacterized protein LOC122030124 [Zingiber officinale]|uniref:uncharacterized protein LOC122030124 n=1 Tax=Zingiber officinale TaxID=94328 RepID=UPI001C4CC13C|nr:uncharacterized protein LOC122030124 [Zingiber officinale]
MATTQAHGLIRAAGVLIRILLRRRGVYSISQQSFCAGGSGGSGHEHNPVSVTRCRWPEDQAAIRGYGGERRPLPGRRSLPFFPPPPTTPVVKAAAAAAEGGGLEESKRRVPSCPDPLHNR